LSILSLSTRIVPLHFQVVVFRHLPKVVAFAANYIKLTEARTIISATKVQLKDSSDWLQFTCISHIVIFTGIF